MTSQKVFEFAKEIGVETLTLMDKIRKWGLPVRSHMAELTEDLMDEIKVKLKEESAPKKKATKKKTAAKKKTTKKAAAKKTTAKKKTIKKNTVKKVAIKKTATRKTTKKAASAKGEEAKPATRKAGTVIRRKKTAKEAEAAAALEAKQAAEAALDAEAMAAAEVALVAEAAEAKKAATAAPEVTPEVVATEAPVPAEESAESKDSTPVAETAVESAPAKAAAPRKREIPMTAQGPISGVSSAKRNIVGKIDLATVRKNPTPRPTKTANRNLRTGFVSSPNMDAPPVDGTVDRFAKRRRQAGTPAPAPAPAAGPSAKEKEQQPPSFVSSDYRKREMVFQPKKKKVAAGPIKKPQITTPAAHKRVVEVFGSMSVSELGQQMGVKVQALIRALMNNGIMGNVNMVLDFDTISLLAPEFKYEAINVKKSDDEMLDDASFGVDDANAVPRSPVVTVMGHVDHGKTTLLDCIRKAKVADGEAGGITQHIGAYRVKTGLGEVTFIDTPGHEAFTAMRARGAHVTDIVILVVAADDGAMPQTIEAINHSKAAGVPIIVAVNKMDKEGANPDKIKKQLAELELLAEDWGGSTQFCPVSALKGDGVDDLLEQVSLLAEIQELKGNPDRSAKGVVIESRVEKGRGNVATVLVQDGTLKKGQHLVIGTIATRVRVLNDENGKAINEAGPSMPVELTGLPETPNAGDTFDVCKDDKVAQEIADSRKAQLLADSQPDKPVSLEALFAKVQAGDLKELPIVLKTDVAGSSEAIKGLFSKISTDEVSIKVIHTAVGAINESDILLASTANGVAVGFNVRPDSGAQRAAKEKGVEIKTYSIVYELVDDMKKALGGLLEPEIREKVLGRVEVREVFGVPKIGTIAGCYVTDGNIVRKSMLRLLRDGKVVYQGKLSSLKRFKDDAKEVQAGYECGIGIENYNDIKVGDEIESYIEESIAREL